MKRATGIILVMAFALFTIGQVVAQDNTAAATDNDRTKQTAAVKQDCGKFTDSNKDGVCDNFAAKGGNSKGANFADADKNGVCDHQSDGTTCKGNSTGCKGDCQHGQKNCCNQSKGAGMHHGNGCSGKCADRGAPGKK
jgi:hypothetical protein